MSVFASVVNRLKIVSYTYHIQHAPRPAHPPRVVNRLKIVSYTYHIQLNCCNCQENRRICRLFTQKKLYDDRRNPAREAGFLVSIHLFFEPSFR